MNYSDNLEFEKLIEDLDSKDLYDIAFAAAHLGMSGDPQAIEPLLNKAINSKEWLIQDFAIRALNNLETRLPQAGEALKIVKKIEPPAQGFIMSIQPTDMTICVSFDFELGTLLIGGRARSGNFQIQLIYKSIINAMELFKEVYPKKPLVISLRLDIVDSANCKALLWLLKGTSQNPNIIIFWYCEEEDPDMIDLVEQYNELGGLRIIRILIPYDLGFHYLSFSS